MVKEQKYNSKYSVLVGKVKYVKGKCSFALYLNQVPI